MDIIIQLKVVFCFGNCFHKYVHQSIFYLYIKLVRRQNGQIVNCVIQEEFENTKTCSTLDTERSIALFSLYEA